MWKHFAWEQKKTISQIKNSQNEESERERKENVLEMVNSLLKNIKFSVENK